jgi:hypothetical protein
VPLVANSPGLDPSSVRLLMPSNGCVGRGSTVLSHSVSAATDRDICAATPSAVMSSHVIRSGIAVSRHAVYLQAAKLVKTGIFQVA